MKNVQRQNSQQIKEKYLALQINPLKRSIFIQLLKKLPSTMNNPQKQGLIMQYITNGKISNIKFLVTPKEWGIISEKIQQVQIRNKTSFTAQTPSRRQPRNKAVPIKELAGLSQTANVRNIKKQEEGLKHQDHDQTTISKNNEQLGNKTFYISDRNAKQGNIFGNKSVIAEKMPLYLVQEQQGKTKETKLTLELNTFECIQPQLAQVRKQINYDDINMFIKFVNQEQLHPLQKLCQKSIKHIQIVMYEVEKIVVTKVQANRQSVLKPVNNELQLQICAEQQCSMSGKIISRKDIIIHCDPMITYQELKYRIMQKIKIKVPIGFIKVYNECQSFSQTQIQQNNKLSIRLLLPQNAKNMYKLTVKYPSSLQMYGLSLSNKSLRVTQQIYQTRLICSDKFGLTNQLLSVLYHEDKFTHFVVFHLFVSAIKKATPLNPIIDWIISTIQAKQGGTIWKKNNIKTNFIDQNYIYAFIMARSDPEVRYKIMVKMSSLSIPIPTYLCKNINQKELRLVKNQELQYVVENGVTIVSISSEKLYPKNGTATGKSYLLNQIFGCQFLHQARRMKDFDKIPYILTKVKQKSFQFPLTIIDIPNKSDTKVQQQLLKCANIIILHSWGSEAQSQNYASKLKRTYKCDVKIYYRDMPNQKSILKQNNVKISDAMSVVDLSKESQNSKIISQIREELYEYIMAKFYTQNMQPNKIFNYFDQFGLNPVADIRQRIVGVSKLFQPCQPQLKGVSQKEKLAEIGQFLSSVYKQKNKLQTLYTKQKLTALSQTSIRKLTHLKHIKQIIKQQDRLTQGQEQKIRRDKNIKTSTDISASNSASTSASIEKYIKKIRLQAIDRGVDRKMFDQLELVLKDKDKNKKVMLQRLQGMIEQEETRWKNNRITLPRIIGNLRQMSKEQKTAGKLDPIDMKKVYQSIMQEQVNEKKPFIVSIPYNGPQMEKEHFLQQYLKSSKNTKIISIIANRYKNTNQLLQYLFEFQHQDQLADDKLIQSSYNGIQFQMKQVNFKKSVTTSHSNHYFVFKFSDVFQHFGTSSQKADIAQKQLLFILSISDLVIVVEGKNRLLDNRQLRKTIKRNIKKIQKHSTQLNKQQSNNSNTNGKQKQAVYKPPLFYEICDNQNFNEEYQLEQERIADEMNIRKYKIFPIKLQNREDEEGEAEGEVEEQKVVEGKSIIRKLQLIKELRERKKQKQVSMDKDGEQKAVKIMLQAQKIAEQIVQDLKPIKTNNTLIQQKQVSILNKIYNNANKIEVIKQTAVEKQTIIQNFQQIIERPTNTSIIFTIASPSKDKDKDKDEQNKLTQFYENVNKIMDNLDTMTEEDFYLTAMICQKILNTELSKQQIQESIQQYQQINTEYTSNKNQLSLLILAFKSLIQSNKQSKLYLVKRSNIRTKMCCKILTTNYMRSMCKYTQVLSEDQWKFDDLANDDKQLLYFVQWYKNGLVQQYGLLKDKIIVHQINKGSIIVTFSYPEPVPGANGKLTQIPFFRKFFLSKQQFSTAGDRDFSKYSPNIERRGGWPYFMPSRGIRYGLRVQDLYDGGNNVWLCMDNLRGQWAVGFHGVSRFGNPPQDENEAKDTVLLKIMRNREKGKMLKIGSGQYYKNYQCQNKPEKKVGEGVYLSPHISVASQYASGQGGCRVGKDIYYLIMQCRIKPSKIKVCPQKNDYWVVNKSKYIRPYGIILLKQDDSVDLFQQLQVPDDEKFTWERYQDQIQQVLSDDQPYSDDDYIPSDSD